MVNVKILCLGLYIQISRIERSIAAPFAPRTSWIYKNTSGPTNGVIISHNAMHKHLKIHTPSSKRKPPLRIHIQRIMTVPAQRTGRVRAPAIQPPQRTLHDLGRRPGIQRPRQRRPGPVVGHASFGVEGRRRRGQGRLGVQSVYGPAAAEGA